MKKYLIFMVIIVVLFIGVVMSITVKTSPASLDEVSIKNVLVSNGAFTISGDFTSSASVYRGNTFKTEGDSLYIEIEKSLPNILHKDSEFLFVVNSDTSYINKVYLMNGDNKMLIWEK